MEVARKERLSGYGKPPWIFKGSALYQLHLVKAETARAIIPKEFKLVEAFGYTLGGFFLASYDESPAGVFDELVVIAGIAWNPPTSCAWAARVLVSSGEACVHGRKEVGLPSRVARFSKRITAVPRQTNGNFLNMIGLGTNLRDLMDFQVTEIEGRASTEICSIKLTTQDINKWKGPIIKMSLPSFSGKTKYNPNLLKYSCRIECRVQAVAHAEITGSYRMETEGDQKEGDIERVVSILLSKPILTLQFSNLNMLVHPPTHLSPPFQTS